MGGWGRGTPRGVMAESVVVRATAMTTAAAVAAVWAGSAPQEVAAQSLGSVPPMELARLTAPVRVDGRLDDAGWEGATSLPLTMYVPVFGGDPTQVTEIRVGYDDDALYFAGWFRDTDPDGIRVNSLYRDRWNGDDAFAIYVDAFNDNQSAKWFGITPAGMRFDVLVSDDGATLNGSWDAFWDARTRITDEGWFAEVRIPFSTLGFQAGPDGSAVMGLTVTRLVSRLNERVTFPAIDPAFEFRQPSKAQDVVVRGVRTSRPMYASPYVLGGSHRSLAANASGPGSAYTTDGTREVGGDLRFAPSSNLTMDLTVNTDFAQVEADDQQVNLDRFPLFFPEKRRFFQERSDLFDFTAGSVRLFHSRRIGLAGDRTPIPVNGGARVVGRFGAWDVGLLDMRTGSAGDLSSENHAVARVQRRIFNDYSTVGVMVTDRSGAGEGNRAVGVDASVRVFGDHYMALKWAGSSDEGDPDGVTLTQRSLWQARLQRRANRGLAYTLEGVRAGSAFDPGMGFQPRTDFTTANFVGNWFILTDESRTFRRVFPGLLAFNTFRNGDGALESAQYAVWVQWETKSGAGGWIEPKVFHEDVLTGFALDDGVVVPAGTYTYADLQLVYTMPAGRRIRSNVDFRTGTFFDGTRTQLSVNPTWNASKHLEVGAEYQYSRIRFADRDQGADIHLGRVRVRAALDARASGNAFLQYNSVSDRLDLNLRLRYNLAEGSDLWLVYNEGLDTDLAEAGPGVPTRSRSVARSLIFKYTHTFGF